MSVQSTLTDSLGRFEFTRPGGSGEYLLTVSAVGYTPVRRRIANETGNRTLEVRLVLAVWATKLQSVKVTAQATPPEPPSVYRVGAGATERLSDGSVAVASPLVNALSDLIRASLGGLSVSDGWSVAGLPGSDSRTELNGLLFRGTSLPRNIPQRIRLSTSTYDIANSGFSGGLVAIEIPPAGEFRKLDLDVASGSSVRAIRGATVGGSSGFSPEASADLGGDWRTPNQRRGLTAGLRLGVREESILDLNAADSATLDELGADPNIVRTGANLLTDRLGGIASASTPHPRQHISLSAVARIDPSLQPNKINAFTFALNVLHDPVGYGSILASPSLGGTRDQIGLVTQWHLNWISRGLALWDWHTGISGSSNTLNPILGGVATVQLDTKAATSDLGQDTPVLLGGSPGYERENRTTLESTILREARAGRRQNHRVRALAAVKLELSRRERPAAAATIGFASLEDFESSMARWANTSVMPTQGEARTIRISTGLGDDWHPHPRLKVQYGLRLDAQNLKGPGILNDELGSLPAGSAKMIESLSPRFGFSWNVFEPKSGEGYRTTNLFQRHLLPSGVLNMGVGLFQRDFDPDMRLSRALSWGPVRTRSCGPIVISGQEWNAGQLTPQAIDDKCAQSTSVPDSTLSVSREAFVPSFAPPSSVRGTASFSTTWRKFDIELGALWNETRRQPGVEDLAVLRRPQTVLASEGDRKFFSLLSAIDPLTGYVRPQLVASIGGFQSDQIVTSNRKTRSTQITLQLSPRLLEDLDVLRFGYVWTRVRALEGGWDRDAFGDPSKVSWGPGVLDRRHQLQLEAGKQAHRISFTVWARASSGAPISPLVAGDVNGDGFSGNDRAFIPATFSPADSLLSRSFNTFLENAPNRIASCLSHHLGTASARGSCRGPWTVTSAFMASVEARTLGIQHRGLFALAIENVGALLDQLVHGGNAHGWGNSGSPNPFLFQVSGYDPVGKRFTYVVNPTFGRIPSNLNDGYRVSFSIGIPLASPVQHQQVERWLIAHGVGQRLPRDTLAARLARNVPALYESILADSDALFLQPEQIAWISAARPAYDAGLAQIWTNLANNLTDLPSDFDVQFAVHKIDAAADEAWEFSRVEAHRLPAVLTPLQLRLLPWPAGILARSDKPVKFRVVYY